MSDYTIKNLKQVGDSAAGRVEGLEARMARSELDSDHLGVSYFNYTPGTRAPYGHKHQVQEEAYVVVSGSGRIKLDDDVLDIEQWDVVRIAPTVIRALEAGPNGLEIIAIGGPRPEEGDGELVPGWWTDSGKTCTDLKPQVSLSQRGTNSSSACSSAPPASLSTTHHDATASLPSGERSSAGSM